MMIPYRPVTLSLEICPMLVDRRNLFFLFPLSFTFSLLVLASSASAADLATVAEKSDFQATSTSAEVSELVGRIAAAADHVQAETTGQTVEGRDLHVLRIANPPVESQEQLRDDPRLVALVLGNIHSGECAGKEALLALARELAQQPEHPLLRDLVILIVPNYNADGNDRVGKGHRSRQAGPAAGAGLRENAQSLDLNRDFTKLDSPESRGLVRLINRWNPHLFIDTHTTNGSYHRYDLTYAGPRNPAVNAKLRDFVAKTFLPAVQAGCSKSNVDTFTYGNFDRPHERWATFGPEGRYSTEYVGLRGRIAILSEAYAYTPYKRRIESSDVFVRNCLQAAAERRDAIRRLLDDVAAEATRAKTVSLQSRIREVGNGVVKGFIPESIDREYYEKTRLVRGTPQDHTVTLLTGFESVKQAQLPTAYLIPARYAQIADRLLMHGVEVRQSQTEKILLGRQYQVQTVKEGRRFQGRQLHTLAVKTADEALTVQPGDYVVPLKQPLGPLAAYLLEPESEDGFATWGFFDHLESGVVYPIALLGGIDNLSLRTIREVEPTKQLTLDEIYGPEKKLNFSGKFPLGLKWVDSAGYHRDWNGRKVYVEAKTGAQRPVQEPKDAREAAVAKLPEVDEKKAKQLVAAATESPDGKALLVKHDNDLFYLPPGADQPVRLTDDDDDERFADFSPDGTHVAFVRNYTLFAVNLATTDTQQLSPDGSENLLFGQLDWVYQEEIYGRGVFKAFWWSPTSKQIAYLRLNEEPVGSYTVANNIPVRQTLEVTRYPKSGDPLPFAALGVVDVASKQTRWIEVPSKVSDETLIVRVGWDPQGERLVYQTQNRRQTVLDLYVADAETLKRRRVLREDSGAWVNVLGEPKWLNDNEFLWLSERTGFKHIYHIDANTGTTRAVTRGPWNVDRLLGVDPQREWIYYSGGPVWPRESHIYRVPVAGGAPEELSQQPGSHSAKFNDDFTYFFDYYSQAGQPIRVDLVSNEGRYLRTLEPNRAERLKYYQLSKPEFVSVLARDGHPLNAMIIRPANFDPSKKYPVLTYVYSGPQAPTVRNRWSGSTYLWHQMLAQKGYVIWMCDNRSAAGSAKHAWPIYGDLGTRELEDIEDGLKWLKSKPWIDEKRIGIWGWSYGGYMTSYALTHSKTFKVGIAGAPVTDWKNYDAVYTERYMDLPQNNKKGYQTSSVVRAAKDLEGRLLLIHGTIDDNVHLGNSLQLAEALQNARRPFRMMLYPQNRHSVGRPMQSRHLRDLMTEFILENL